VQSGWFVTGTDTGVGKTVLTAAIVAALRSAGVPVRAFKPVITGLEQPADPHWPPDHELLARAAGSRPEHVALVGFDPPVSPHLAAQLAGAQLNADELADSIRAQLGDRELAVVEGVGGLLVPLSWDQDVRDLARELAMPVLVASRPGLGTINHTLLTLEAARAADLHVEAVVLTPWPEDPGAIELSNRETIERLGGVEVWTLPRIERAEPHLLAAAGSGLPLVMSWSALSSACALASGRMS
jgi:dethiobiotin synthetase